MFCLSAGCRRDDQIQTYRIPKENVPAMPMERAAPEARPHDITWTTPSGWKEQAPSSFRVGSFTLTGVNGQSADVSVIPLSGQAGGDLANINRWRGQINLSPLTQADLPKESRSISPHGQPMLLVDFLSTERLIDNKFKKRLIAAIYKQGDRSWFFKMAGEEATVEAAKPVFLKFLESVRFHHE